MASNEENIMQLGHNCRYGITRIQKANLISLEYFARFKHDQAQTNQIQKVLNMTTKNLSKRGRPKGTGLDDRRQLLAIACLMIESPDLKPTTAIKSLGITNPSTVRRLRDKFNLHKEALSDEASKQKSDQSVQPQSNDRDQTDSDDAADFRPLETMPVHSEKTSPVSAATCALAKKKDHKIIDQDNGKRKNTKKSTTTTAKKVAKHNNPASVKQRTPAKETSTTLKTSESSDKQARVPAPVDPMNLFNAWLDLSAQIIDATVKTQVQLFEISENSNWYAEAFDLQIKARDAWLCSFTPNITIRHTGE